jgi:hypothetical protein
MLRPDFIGQKENMIKLMNLLRVFLVRHLSLREQSHPVHSLAVSAIYATLALSRYYTTSSTRVEEGGGTVGT